MSFKSWWNQWKCSCSLFMSMGGLIVSSCFLFVMFSPGFSDIQIVSMKNQAYLLKSFRWPSSLFVQIVPMTNELMLICWDSSYDRQVYLFRLFRWQTRSLFRSLGWPTSLFVQIVPMTNKLICSDRSDEQWVYLFRSFRWPTSLFVQIVPMTNEVFVQIARMTNEFIYSDCSDDQRVYLFRSFRWPTRLWWTRSTASRSTDQQRSRY